MTIRYTSAPSTLTLLLKRRFYVFISEYMCGAKVHNERNTFDIFMKLGACAFIPARKWTMFAQITMQVMQQQWFLMLSMLSRILDGNTIQSNHTLTQTEVTHTHSFAPIPFSSRDKKSKISERFTYTTSSRFDLYLKTVNFYIPLFYERYRSL